VATGDDDIELYVEGVGDPSGPPLVLIAGHGAQLLFWHPELVDAFVARGFFVVRFDNRDVGLSTHLDAAGVPDVWAAALGGTEAVPYLIEDMADDVAGMLAAMGLGAAHVLGISLGGMIAQSLAIRHGDRVASLTSLMSTPAPLAVGTPRDEVIEQWLAPSPTSREGIIEASVASARRHGSPLLGLDEPWLRELAGASFDRCFDPDGVTRQLAAVVASPDRRPGLAQVAVPTLVVHGADDPVVTVEGGEATADAVPGARLVIFDKMGHDIPRAIWPALVDDVAALAGR